MIDVCVCVCLKAPSRQVMHYWLQQLQQKRWEYSNTRGSGQRDSWSSPTLAYPPSGLVSKDNGRRVAHTLTHTHTQTHTLAASHPGTKLRVNTSFWWINVCSGYSDSCFLEKKMGCVTVERALNEISIKGMKEKDSTLSGVCFYVNALWLCRLPAVCKIHAYHGRINSAQQHLQYKQEDVLNINIITSRGLSFYTSAWRCSHSRCWPRWRQTG